MRLANIHVACKAANAQCRLGLHLAGARLLHAHWNVHLAASRANNGGVTGYPDGVRPGWRI